MHIYCGDFKEVLPTIPDGSVDLVLTDPPYGMGFVSNYRNLKYNPIKNDDGLWWLSFFMEECYRVMKDNTAGYIFCSHHHIDRFVSEVKKVFNYKGLLIWNKNNTSMGDLTANFASRTEFVIFFQKGRRLINGRRDDNVLNFKKTGNNLHPTEKPVDMLEYLISKFSNAGDVVLDPFMGSGSTGVACMNTNREFIGCEIDEGYFSVAEKRLMVFK